MRLVEDDGRVLGEDRRVELLANAEVGEVERVVDDHEVRLARTASRGFREAHADERAPSAEAPVCADRELAPEALRRLEGQLGPVACLRLVEPRPQPLERLGVLFSREERSTEQAEPVDAPFGRDSSGGP